MNLLKFTLVYSKIFLANITVIFLFIFHTFA